MMPPAPPSAALRRLVPADAAWLAALQRLAFDDPADGEWWTAATWAALLAEPGVYGFAALAGPEPAGFAVARTVAGETEILSVGVAPARRRHGHGRHLVEAVAARAPGPLLLEVAADNAAARALYAAAGFAVRGRRRGYYRRRSGPADALVLARPIPGCVRPDKHLPGDERR